MDLSIIITIKYFDKHLEDCIKSIVSQKIKNYEIILASPKNDIKIDAFILSFLKQYNLNNIKIVQLETDDFNDILNQSIKEAKGKYIHILDSNTILFKDFYNSFFEKLEEYNYDLMIVDYLNIKKDLNLNGVYSLYDKLSLKNKFKNKNNESKHITELKESGLIFDFSKVKKNNKKNIIRKNKDMEYISSNLCESIQFLEKTYRDKLLLDLNFIRESLIIKSELIDDNTFSFPYNLNTKIDLFKTVVNIQSVSNLEYSLVGKYEIKNIKNNSIKKTKDSVKEKEKIKDRVIKIEHNLLIFETKKYFNKVFNELKKDQITCNNQYYITEYLVINEVLKYKSNISFKIKSKQILDEEYNNFINKKYFLEIFDFLSENILSDENPFFNLNYISSIKFKLLIKKLNREIEKEELLKFKNETKIKNEEKEKYKNKDKIINNKQKKKQSKKTFKKHIGVFKRKIRFDVNRIKRTRINYEILINTKENISRFKNKILFFLNKFKEKIKMFFSAKKNNKKEKILLLDTNKVLRLNEGRESNIATIQQNEDTKTEKKELVK